MADTHLLFNEVTAIYATMRRKTSFRDTCESCDDTKLYCTGANHKDCSAGIHHTPEDFFLNLNKQVDSL